MERASRYEGVISLIALPVEVLVYIISFLSTREKVEIRCVSKRLRSACEIPSLWKEFVWTRYAPRDEKPLKTVLKTFGQHIKRFHFADHISPSKLQVMLKSCKNVIHLSLPSFQYNTLEKLEKFVSSTASLQIVDILRPKPFSGRPFIQQIFRISRNLKVLSLHYVPASLTQLWTFNEQILIWLEEWANFNYVPKKLNIVFNRNYSNYLQSISTSLQSSVSTLRSNALPTNFESGHSAWFNISFNDPIDFSPVVPALQLRVTGSSVVLPSVKASKYGILGLDYDTLLLTEGSCHGKIVHKALLTATSGEHIDASVSSLASVTYFDASSCRNLYPGHLEQLSIACPNLQRLDLSHNSKCLSNLQGLQSLANNCKSLQELNLWRVHEMDCEYSCLQLWEVLCTMCLIQLAIEVWMINVHDKRNPEVPISSQDCSVAAKLQRLIEMFQNYTSLKVLEVSGTCGDGSCSILSDHELSVASYFPSITSYRLCNLPCTCVDRCHTIKQIFSCKYLRCLYLSLSFGIVLPSLEGHCSSLKQLYIHSGDLAPTETFIDSLCGLEHVILSVKALTAKSINSIIEKSPNLITCHIILHTEVFVKGELIPLLALIKTKFSKRRLFNGGNFVLRQGIYVVDYNSSLSGTELLSIWDGNNN